jgi:two-component system sensor histidine kinase and response regulator WspE
MSNDLEDLSLFDLFRMEAEEQVRALQNGLLALESGYATPATLEALMRAAHSIKGAARIVGLDVIVHLTHLVEERFVAAQQGHRLSPAEVDRMLTATDWLARLQAVPVAETAEWLKANSPAIESFAASLAEPLPGDAESSTPIPQSQPILAAATLEAEPAPVPLPSEPEEDIFAQRVPGGHSGQQRQIRIAADGFDRIMSLSSEMLVTSRTLAAFAPQFDLRQRFIARAVQILDDPEAAASARTLALRDVDRQNGILAMHIAEFDQATRAHERVAEDLYRGVLAGRLRPFSDGIRSALRLVRDTARELGKQVALEVQGENTRVDRDLLERLEAPISHLLTNAINHGIETPAQRIASGKPPLAWLRIRARHENGRLVISVKDDGRGVDPQELRERVVARGLVSQETAGGLYDAELLEFLFLPGFSTRDSVNAVSGRGVGLNIVQSMVQDAGGSVVVSTEPHVGTTFRLTLPVTRSVIRVLRIQVDGETYAVPLVHIDRVATLEPLASLDPALHMSAKVPSKNFRPVTGTRSVQRSRAEMGVTRKLGGRITASLCPQKLSTIYRRRSRNLSGSVRNWPSCKPNSLTANCRWPTCAPNSPHLRDATFGKLAYFMPNWTIGMRRSPNSRRRLREPSRPALLRRRRGRRQTNPTPPHMARLPRQRTFHRHTS